MSDNNSKGSINRLDTKSFTDAISMYARHRREFSSIVRGVNNTCSTMSSNWVGRGRNAFEADYKKVQTNLEGIAEIMDEISEALRVSANEYATVDTEISNKMNE